MVLLTMLIIPMLVALGFFIFGGRKINFWEFLIQNAVQLIIMACFIGIINWRNTEDVEIWNGRIADKEHHHIHCQHSYPCHCHMVCSGSGKSRSCYTHCDTCYEHSFDVEWNAKTTNNEGIEIDTIDSQGLIEPPRWGAIQIGEPTALTHAFKNYVKGAPDSLFRKQGLVEKFKDKIPAYPKKVYDYYHVNRFVTVGVTVPDAALWAADLEELNASLGKAKQVNVIIVVVKNMPEDYFYALEQAWLGGKKNDFVVVLNVDDQSRVVWSDVMAWSDNKMAETAVRFAMVVHGSQGLDRMATIDSIKTNVQQYFVRKPMKDFEYLSHQTKPTMWEWIIAMLLGLTVSVGIGIFYMKSDLNE